MALIQTFHTFLADSETGYSVRVEILPQRALAERIENPTSDIRRVAAAIDGAVIAEIELAGSALPRALAAVIAGTEVASQFGTAANAQWWDGLLANNRQVATLVEDLAYRPLIPSEMSPLELRSLADIATTGAVVLALAHGGPVLVIAGVAGIILVRGVDGFSRGAGRAFEEAGYDWTRRLLRLPPSQDGKGRDKR